MGKAKRKTILKSADFYHQKVASTTRGIDPDSEPRLRSDRSKKRHIPDGVVLFVEACHKKHGYDFDAMSKDKKVNPFLKSPGQIRQMFKRYALLPGRADNKMVGGLTRVIEKSVKLDLAQIVPPRPESDSESSASESEAESESEDDEEDFDDDEMANAFGKAACGNDSDDSDVMPLRK